jgi:SAM-dependent methyltransferase
MKRLKRALALRTLWLLRNDRFRFHFVKLRYQFLKRRMRFFETGSGDIGEKTIPHNLSAFLSDAAFGCGGRMALLIYPLAAYFHFYQVRRQHLKILVVGPRTEDDIFWLKAYGFLGTTGLDLFSYSNSIDLGDIHHSGIPGQSVDAVLLGWMISYSKDPEGVIRECRRILKPGGLLGIGIEHNPNQIAPSSPRVNSLNTLADLETLIASSGPAERVFGYDHYNEASGDFGTAVLSRLD